MSDPPPDPDAHPELLPLIRRILDAPDAGQYADALDVVTEAAETAAVSAWERTEGKPPTERLLAAITEASEVLEGLAVDLTGTDQGGGPSAAAGG